MGPEANNWFGKKLKETAAKLFMMDLLIVPLFLFLKGQCNEMNIFLMSTHFSQYSNLCVCADSFQGLLKAFYYPLQ
jgi:hypothetical protein